MDPSTDDINQYSGRPSGLTGTEIAGYRVERELGRGGMAVVYCARDLRLDRTVALKLLAPGLARNDTFRRRFTHESRVAAAIEHPHIVPVFEAGETQGILYIAMRYVAGLDLRALLDRDGPLPVAAALRITGQLASALDAAHEHDLVHRDVKPGNVLVAKGVDSEHPEHVYLTDFGLTKKSLSLTGFTTVGEFVGTLDYVAPEQISGRPVDGRCDLYSLACVVFEMLTGAPPFQRDEDIALLWAHQYDEPPPLTGKRPDIAPAADAVLARALAKVPEDRYDSCLDFVAALRRATSRAAAPAQPAPAGAADGDPAGVARTGGGPVGNGAPGDGAPGGGGPPGGPTGDGAAAHEPVPVPVSSAGGGPADGGAAGSGVPGDGQEPGRPPTRVDALAAPAAGGSGHGAPPDPPSWALPVFRTPPAGRPGR